MSSGTKPEVKESDDSSQMYIYVDHKKPIALKSMSEQGWYKVVHRENGEGNGDVSNDRASDYFNVKSRAASERELKKQTEKLTVRDATLDTFVLIVAMVTETWY